MARTTAALPCARVTVVTEATAAGESARVRRSVAAPPDHGRKTILVNTLGSAGPRPPLSATRREANPNPPVQAEPVSAGLRLRRRAPTARVGRPTWWWASLPSVYTLGSGEGRLRPPSNPRLPRRCGCTGRTGAPPPNPRTGARSPRSGAPLWSPILSGRTGPPTPGGGPPAPRGREGGPRGRERPRRAPDRRPWSASPARVDSYRPRAITSG